MKNTKKTTGDQQPKSQVKSPSRGGQQAVPTKIQAGNKGEKQGLERDGSIKNSK